MKKAIFLDRDGVINIDYGHVHKISDFKFINGIFEFCRKAVTNGYLIIIVTNQAGISKNIYSENDFVELTKWMENEFSKNGILITKTYYCPHKDEDECFCRKPKPGMLLNAIIDYKINIKYSILIGDKMSDLDAGYNAGINELYFLKGSYESNKRNYKFTLIDELKEINL